MRATASVNFTNIDELFSKLKELASLVQQNIDSFVCIRVEPVSSLDQYSGTSERLDHFSSSSNIVLIRDFENPPVALLPEC